MSEIITDNLTGKTSAGDVTITSEGGSATMQLQQGVAKAWVNINGVSGTPVARDSLNTSSLTDISTGRYAPVLTNPMDNTTYCPSGTSNAYAGDSFNQYATIALAVNLGVTTTTTTFEVSNYFTSYVDSKYCFVTVNGDLA